MATDLPPGLDPDRLNGWKEIGAFLGKAPRTVQRWEHEYRLPVHRVGRPDGQIVWASRRELDEWARTHGGQAATREEPLLAESPPTTGRSAVKVSWPRPGLLLLALALFVAAAMFWWREPGPGRPDSWEFRSGRLAVFDHEGREVFSRQIGDPGAVDYDPAVERRPGGRVVLTDLDGDGDVETILGAGTAASPADAGVFVFDADGSERFAFHPQNEVTFGDVTYAGPWLPHHVWVVADGPAHSIYAAFIGLRGFPCLLVDLDARGKVRGEYWSDGHIESVARATWHGRTALFVGAGNNDTAGASLAVFEDGVTRGSAPVENPEYRCTSCSDGGPSEFLLFPRRAVGRAMPGKQVATIQELRIERDGKISVNVAEGSKQSDGTFRSIVWYTLADDLTPLEAQLTAGLLAEHADWQARGAVPAWSPVDEEALFPVRRWVATTQQFAELLAGLVVR